MYVCVCRRRSPSLHACMYVCIGAAYPLPCVCLPPMLRCILSVTMQIWSLKECTGSFRR